MSQEHYKWVVEKNYELITPNTLLKEKKYISIGNIMHMHRRVQHAAPSILFIHSYHIKSHIP